MRDLRNKYGPSGASPSAVRASARGIGRNRPRSTPAGSNARRPRTAQAPQLVVGDVVYDPATQEVRIGTQVPALTATERGILEMLMRRSPTVVDRRSIAQSVWENDADALGSNTIDVHMARLRTKLAGGQVRIESVRAVGYRILGQ